MTICVQVCYDFCVFTRVPLSSFLLLFSASQKLKEKQSSFVKDTTLKVYEVIFACIYQPHSLVSNKMAGKMHLRYSYRSNFCGVIPVPGKLKNMSDHGGNGNQIFELLVQCFVDGATRSCRFEYVIFEIESSL